MALNLKCKLLLKVLQDGVLIKMERDFCTDWHHCQLVCRVSCQQVCITFSSKNSCSFWNLEGAG